MYRGFNVIDFPYFESFYEKGKSKYNQQKNYVNHVLDTFVTADGALDGSKLQENWFPQIDCDIFISHSHKDEDKAIALAGFLSSLGLNSFIDSCIWGYSNKLLRLIDERHCYNESSNTFDYNLRNYTTSHVHMMLSNALFKMIDSSECVFFINTPSSIKAKDVISKTVSPWIYSEISIAQIVRKKTPDRRLFKSESRNFSDQNINESINIEYDVNLSHLTEMKESHFLKWEKLKNGPGHPLDNLYRILPLSNNQILNS